MKPSYINSKKELFEYLQLNISTAYKQLLKKQKLDFDSSLLKTFLIEQDIPNGKDLEQYLLNSFSITDGGKEIQPLLRRTSDNELINLYYAGIADLYIDMSNERIWNLYTLSNSKIVEKIINHATSSVYFDKTWLHHDFLLNLRDNENTHTRGFGLNFDYRKFDSDEEMSPVLKMQLSGIKLSSFVYDKLMDINGLKENISLSKIKLKTYSSDLSASFILEDIQYYGKITARGNDINQHFINTLSIKKKYLDLINNIEVNYRVGWRSANTRNYFDGYPIYFVKIDDNPMDVDLVCDKIFDGSLPFKLFGKSTNIPNGKLIQVVDSHIGGVFTVQLYPDMFVFYINEEVCGNTILRFFSNIQHFFSNNFVIQNDNGDSII